MCWRLERLSEQAYQRWKSDLKNVTQDEFYKRLDPIHRNAVLLWEFQTQWFNGGIRQWIANGYAEWINELINIVRQIGTESARSVFALLEEVRNIVNDSDDEQENDLSERLAQCDDRYYKLSGRFGEDVEAWLEREYQQQRK